MSSVTISSTQDQGFLPRLLRWAPLIGLGLAVIALLLLAAGPLGWRLGWWHFRFAFFYLMTYSAYVAIAAVVVSALALLVRRTALGGRGMMMGLAGLAVGAVLVYVPWYYNSLRGTVPPIHDITTDFASPPELVAVLPARKAEEGNPVAYEGDKIAELQRKAYPEIAPLMLALPPQEAFKRAVDAAKERGLAIVFADEAAGKIEASQSSRWFGFTDDCAIRVAAQGIGSRVDMRCVSRQGRSDFGVNAKRVATYLAALKKNAG